MARSYFTFNHIGRDKWDAIFGEAKPFESSKRKASGGGPHLVAIHGDDAAKRMFSGYDVGLGREIDPTRPREHRREIMRELNVECCG